MKLSELRKLIEDLPDSIDIKVCDEIWERPITEGFVTSGTLYLIEVRG